MFLNHLVFIKIMNFIVLIIYIILIFYQFCQIILAKILNLSINFNYKYFFSDNILNLVFLMLILNDYLDFNYHVYHFYI